MIKEDNSHVEFFLQTLAFCKKSTSVTIPYSVTIEENAFWKCDKYLTLHYTSYLDLYVYFHPKRV